MDTVSQRCLLRRKSTRVGLTVALALITIGADTLLSQRQAPPRGRRTVVIDGREAVEGEVIVRYHAQAGDIGRERTQFQVAADTEELIGRVGTRRLRSRNLTTEQMLQMLRSNPDVVYAEPNYIIRALAVPNDPMMNSLWGLLNTGQVVDGQAGVAGADIGATDAWDISTGSKATVVAILDSGIDFNHPDLAANVFTAPRQFSVTIGGTTVTCMPGTHGFSALNNSCVPFDENGHGTHVAGIIGAVGNNGLGVTGVNWTANIMALKVLGADGTGTTSDAIKAINWAIKAKAALGADANVRVLNASWGGSVFSQALDDEIAAAHNADMLFVAAAGSDGRNTDTAPHYPASSTKSNVVSVGAVENRGELAPYSNYGATSVDLAAPGASTTSTWFDDGYEDLGGTSMSAAFVSGAATLVLSVCPSNTATLKSRLMSSVDTTSSLSGKTVSGGRLNVGTALQRCLAKLHATASGTTVTAIIENGPGNLTDWVGLYCPATNADTAYVEWKYLNGTRTTPTSPISNATVTFQAPSSSSSCNVRLFANNGWDKLATSETVMAAASPTLTIGDVSVAEGNSGTTTATFTVTLSPVNASQTVTVNFATANGSATAGSDYVASSGTLDFPPSTGSRTISVTVNGDIAFEPNETLLVNLSGAVNATIGDAQAVGTIINDDAPPPPSVTINTSSVSPGGQVQFTVSNGPANPADWVGLYASTANDFTHLNWVYLSGTRQPPATGMSGATLAFTAPSTPGTYNIRFFANNDYTKLATSANFTVASQPSLSINDVSLNEGNSGSTVATFTVTLSPVNASQTVTVNYSTANGSATAGSDYVAASGTLTFAPSVGSQTISVTINGDTATEPSETVLVNLSNASNATIGDAQGVLTIVNDDAPPGPAVTIDTPNVSPGGQVQFTVSNGPGDSTDWVGLYASTANDFTHQNWMYLNGTRQAPATGLTTATLVFTAPTTPGTYNVRFFAKNDYTKLATSANFTVAAQPPSVSAPASAQIGTSMAITIANGPGNPTDWIGVYVSGAADNAYVAWYYLNGTRVVPATGVSNGTLNIPAPSTAGTYEVRLFAENGYTRLATSGAISVQP